MIGTRMTVGNHHRRTADEGGVAVQPRRVLYIEDDADSVQLARTLLESIGDDIELVSAADGSSGLELARTWAPQLILLDLELPDMDGSDVLRALSGDERTRAIPVIVVSANADARESDAIRAAGLAGYLVKPIAIAEFMALIGRTLR
jgi:CheY-like chemotaxis protein